MVDIVVQALFASWFFYILLVLMKLYFHYDFPMRTKWQYIIILTLLSIPFTLFILKNTYVKFFGIIAITYLATVFVLKLKPLIAIKIILVAYIFLSFMETIFFLIAVNFWPAITAPNRPIYSYYIASLVIYFFMHMVLVSYDFLKRNLFFENLFGKINKQSVKIYFIVVVILWVVFFCIYVYLIATRIYDYIPITAAIFLITLAFVVMTLVVVNRLKQEQQFNSELAVYQETIENLYENTRAFRHNYKNTLLSFNGYIKEGDINGLTDYVNQLIGESEVFSEARYMTGIAHISDPGLKWLVISKLSKAQRLEQILSVNVSVDFSVTIIPQHILNEVIGILLDNAIEAAQSSLAPQVELSLLSSHGGSIIEVKNTFGNPPELHKIFEKNYSTKEHHSGIGLFRLKQLLAKYSNVTTNVTIEDEMFVSSIEIFPEDITA